MAEPPPGTAAGTEAGPDTLPAPPGPSRDPAGQPATPPAGQAVPGPSPEPSLARVSLRCLCPRCGEGTLFTRLLVLRPACPVCGLDLSEMDVGDAMAVPLLIVVGAIVVAAAFWVEFTFYPPLWVHMVLWPVVTIPLTIALMRPAKAFLVAQQYRTQMRGEA